MVKQSIEIDSTLDEQKPYLLGASDIASVSVPTKVVVGSGGVVAWLANSSVKAGTRYTVTSTVSDADVNELREIPMPDQAPKSLPPNLPPDASPPVEYYNQQTVADFTQLPSNILSDKRIPELAQQIVKDAHAQTMYDKVVAIETYLRSHYTYSTDITPAPGMDPVLWFLFSNPNKDGYCTYFATAMTLLTRSLGIPARFVTGYTSGTQENGSYVVRGVDAHSWTQVYFAGYGWINFEPSATFKTFTRPQPQPSSNSSIGATNTTQGGVSISHLNGQAHKNLADQNSGASNTGSVGSQTRASQIGIILGSVALLLLLACIFFSLWWKRLFRQYSFSAQLYGRVCVLADWAGIKRQRSQTPYEYMQQLAISAVPSPEFAPDLARLNDIYVREQWADPMSDEHPSQTGEINELPMLWKRLQPELFIYVAKHPVFIRRVPAWIRLRLHTIVKKVHEWRQGHKPLQDEF
jgi:transglutaminase-like putative cysteine protease